MIVGRDVDLVHLNPPTFPGSKKTARVLGNNLDMSLL